MARRAWFRASEYKGVFPAKELHDGSIVEGTQGNASDQFVLTRVYPWGFEQKIVYRILPNGETKYEDIGPGPESPNQLSGAERTKAFERDLANGQVKITARGPIPGAGLGRTYDSATRKNYKTSEEFEKEYDRMGLAKATRADLSQRHVDTGGDGEVSSDPRFAIRPFTGDSPPINERIR